MDDDPLIRDLARRMLKTNGFMVATAEDGEKAVAMYRTELNAGIPYDTVILDLTVPGGMGGLETAEQLLELDVNARLIVSSGYADNPILADHAAYGFIDVIPKPYTKRQLLEVLERVLN